MLKTLEEYASYKVEEGPLKVEKIKILQGANYFSAGPVVLIRLNLCEYDEVFSNEIPGFYDTLNQWLPSLHEHHCSEGRPGGFLFRVKKGTLLGHISEHIGIELQTLAGMDVAYGKTRSTLQQGVYNIIFRFFDEMAGIFAGKAAINLVNAILTKKKFNVQEVVNSLIDIREKRLFGPSTQAIVDEADNRNIPYLRLDAYNLVQLGTGKYLKKIRATLTSDTNLIGVETADNKYLTNLMLKDAGIPVLRTIKTNSLEEAYRFRKTINAPVVIKPYSGYLGKNLMVNLKTKLEIKKGFKLAQQFDEDVIVQPLLEGKLYRLLVIDYKFVAATQLMPPWIVGDGEHTIGQLIDIENNLPERRIGDKGYLSQIPKDEITENILKQKKLTYQTILKVGEKLFLKNTGNPKLGGSSLNVTEKVHPFNQFLAERAAKVLGLNVAGIDFIAPDIEISITENGGKLLEVNAAPDFRMHIKPTKGEAIPVEKALLDMLFPENASNRVPIFSVTGTAGKTTYCLLLNYCLQKEGYYTGLATSDGLYIDGNQLMQGDMTYPEHVKLVLKDPTIDSAILETSREGILRSGLGYKFADYGIVLNMLNDHVGADDIKYIEDLAYAKSVVAEEVYEEGYTILNADYPLVLEMKERLYSKLALYSKEENNKELNAHMFRGGLGVYLKDGVIHINFREKQEKLMHIHEIPLTFQGKAKFMFDSILAVITTLYAHGVQSEKIKMYLKAFTPNSSNLPGRLNFFDISDFKVLLDYAHNIASFEGLNAFLTHFDKNKIGVIDAAGDRLDEEIIEMGEIAAGMFNEIILYEGYDMRGRKKGEIINLLKKGLFNKGFNPNKIKTKYKPVNAWKYGLDNAKKDDLVVVLSARSLESINFLNNYTRKT